MSKFEEVVYGDVYDMKALKDLLSEFDYEDLEKEFDKKVNYIKVTVEIIPK